MRRRRMHRARTLAPSSHNPRSRPESRAPETDAQTSRGPASLPETSQSPWPASGRPAACARLAHLRGQRLRDDVHILAVLQRHILNLRPKRHRHARRQRPRRRRPDDRPNRLALQPRINRLRLRSSAYRTYTLGEVCISYSTSASASAVWSCEHQYTGFSPL
jgi:hypothetical protein